MLNVLPNEVNWIIYIFNNGWKLVKAFYIIEEMAITYSRSYCSANFSIYACVLACSYSAVPQIGKWQFEEITTTEYIKYPCTFYCG